MKIKLLYITLGIILFGLILYVAQQTAIQPVPEIQFNEAKDFRTEIKDKKQISGSVPEKNILKISAAVQDIPSEFIKSILEDSDYNAAGFRANKIKKMKMTRADFNALTGFLKDSPSKDSNYLGLHSLKNEIIEAMIANGAFVKELGDEFLNILEDDNQHPVIVDYVLQYIPEYFNVRWNKSESHEQQEIVKTLYSLMDRQDDSIAGTALNSLVALSEIYPIVDQEILSAKAFAMADNTTLTQASRCAALHYIGRSDSDEADEILENLSFDTFTPVMVRMVALSSLTNHAAANEKDLNNLTERIQKEILSASNEDRRLITAAKAATENLINIQRGK